MHLVITGFIFFVTVLTQLVISLILALIIHSKIKGKEFF